MKYRNNLSDVSTNSFFAVTAPFEVFIHVGHAESNCYVGASRLFGAVYRKVTVAPGDEIHDLCGGVFAVFNGVAFSATMKIDDRGVFERGEPEPQEWPTGSLAPIARGRECVYHKPQTLKMAAGTPVGHGIHSVLA